MKARTVVLVALLAMVGCDKGQSAGAAPAASATAAQTRCAAGDYQNGDPPFCFTAPAGLKAAAPTDWDKTMFVDFSGAAGQPEMKVSWYKDESDISRYDEMLGFVPKRAAEDKKQIVSTDATAGGKGKVFVLKNDFNQEVQAYYKGSKRLWECYAIVPKDKPVQPELDACKGFSPP